MDETRPMRPDVAAALTMLRVLWAALLVGQGVFFAVVLWVVRQGSGVPSLGAQTLQTLLLVCSITLIAAIVGGYALRMQFYKANWQADIVAPRGYFVGNLLLLAMLEAVSMFSLVLVLLSGALVPAIGPCVVAVASQLINFPTGRAMRGGHGAADDESER